MVKVKLWRTRLLWKILVSCFHFIVSDGLVFVVIYFHSFVSVDVVDFDGYILLRCAVDVSTTCRPVMEGIASDVPRVLTEEEQSKLKKQDESIASEFKRQKLEAESRKNWDLFYKRNETRFFKDRHWTIREFQQLVEIDGDSKKILLEVGCGVGNFLFPLLEENVGLFMYGCDFSPRAIQLVKSDPRYNENRMKVFVSDVTTDR